MTEKNEIDFRKHGCCILYPVYINAKMKISDGRRIPIKECIDNPTPAEVGEACKQLNLPYEIESNKAYSRDYLQKGRVKIQFKKDEENLVRKDIHNRRVLFKAVAGKISKMQRNQSGPSEKRDVGKKKKKR